MKLFISKKLSVSKEDAFVLQKNFTKKYGTTLYGLMKHYKFDPDEFLDFVHDVDLSKLKKILNCLKKLKVYQEKNHLYKWREGTQKKFWIHLVFLIYLN